MIRKNLWLRTTLLLAALSLLFGVSGVRAQEPVVELWFDPQISQVNAGGSTTVKVMVNAQVPVGGFDLTFTYDPNMVVLESWKHGGFLSALFELKNENTPGRLWLVSVQLAKPSIAGEGTLLEFTLNGVGGGTSELTLSEVTFADAAGVEYSAGVTNGSISVGGDPLPTATNTLTSTSTATPTATHAIVPGQTSPAAPTATLTATLTPTNTATQTPTKTNAITATASQTPTVTRTSSTPYPVPGTATATRTPLATQPPVTASTATQRAYLTSTSQARLTSTPIAQPTAVVVATELQTTSVAAPTTNAGLGEQPTEVAGLTTDPVFIPVRPTITSSVVQEEDTAKTNTAWIWGFILFDIIALTLIIYLIWKRRHKNSEGQS